MHRLFTSISEPIAGHKWLQFFNERWPAYSAWLKGSAIVTDSKEALECYCRAPVSQCIKVLFWR